MTLKRKLVTDTRKDNKINSPHYYQEFDDTFSDGSIQCIKLKDFMTFEKITLSPSAGLNIIIGPNGSGKSSIACAIGLGLGSNVNVLQRANKISSYIRHDCSHACIQILLKGNPSVWIKRRIARDNSSKWQSKVIGNNWIDKTHAEIMEIISKMHIKLDNLCMFLPQERVKEFSSLSSYDLLEATEQAINSELFAMHQNLLRDSKEMKEYEKKINDVQNKVNRISQSINIMENGIDKLKQYEKAKRVLNETRSKLVWARYYMANNKLQMKNDELNEEMKQFDEKCAHLQPVQERIDELDALINECKEEIKKSEHILENTKKQLSTKESELSNSLESLETKKKKLVDYTTRSNEVDNEIQLIEKSIEVAKSKIEESLKESPDYHKMKEELDAKYKEIKIKIVNNENESNILNNKASAKKSQIAEIKEKLRQASDRRRNIIDYIQNRLKRTDIAEMATFCENNKNLFTAEVYGPLCVECNFKDKKAPQILEMIVERHILLGFLVQNDDDFNILEQFKRSKKYHRITIINASSSERENKRTEVPDLSQYGFSNYADQLFESPAPVKNLINDLSEAFRVPIGYGSNAKKHAKTFEKDFFPKNRITRYVLDDYIYYIQRSRYSESVSIMSSPLKTGGIFHSTRNTESIDDLRQELSKKEGKLQNIIEKIQKLKHLTSEQNEQSRLCLEELKEVRKKLSLQSKSTGKLEELETKKNQLKKEKKNLLVAIENQEKKIKSIITLCSDSVSNMANFLKDFQKTQQKLDILYQKEDLYDIERNEKKKFLEHEQKGYDTFRANISQLKEEVKKLKQSREEKKKIAMEICPLNDENKEYFNESNLDYQSLKSEYEKHQLTLKRQTPLSPRLLEEYEEEKQNLTTAQAELEELNNSNQKLLTNFDISFTEWKQRVANEIQTINSSFSSLMRTCNYRGEIRFESDDPEKINTYRISVLVSFHQNAQLSVLSSMRQSGGEKSLTTLMYLLALQDCTRFPFRLVDEINQGMDEENDRFSLTQVLSYSLRKNHLSQYFLITPKLISNMPKIKGVTVMVVMNGNHIDASLYRPIEL